MPTYIGNTATSNITTGNVIGSSLTISTAAGKIIAGATSLSIRNNADSADNFKILDAGSATLRSTLTITAGGVVLTDDGITFNGTSEKIIQPVTSLVFRDHGDANTNITVLDSGATTIRGAITPTGGVAAAGGFATSPRLCHTGGVPAIATTSGTNSATNTAGMMYLAEVFVPANMSVTGVAIFNGTAVAGNGKVALFSVSGTTGTRVAVSASTAMSGTTAYQLIPFTGAPIAVVGPATYFIGAIYDTTTHDLRGHVIGSFATGTVGSLTYATDSTFATLTVPTTFTADLGPIASLY